MDDKDDLTRRVPAPGPSAAATLREQIQPLCDLTVQHAFHRLTNGERLRLRRAEEAEGGEARHQRQEALRRLRTIALEVAQGAADGVVKIDARLSTMNDESREAANELSRDPSRSVHERMMLIGLWAPVAAVPRQTVRRHVLVRRRDAARVRRARAK